MILLYEGKGQAGNQKDKAKEASAVMRDVKQVMQPEQPQRRQVNGWDMEL